MSAFIFILHSTCYSVGMDMEKRKNAWVSNMANIRVIADGTIKGHKKHK